jgi:hypothetical protein
MLAAPASARIAIDKHVSRTGPLSGSGKGVAAVANIQLKKG